MNQLALVAVVLGLAAYAGAQGVVLSTQSVVHPNPTALQPSGPDVPQVPRGALATPRKHGMPEVPIARGVELPPGRPTEVGAPHSPQGGFSVYRNTTFGRAAGEVAEPTCAHSGQYGLQTANWYAYATADAGQSWSYVNPYTRFTASDGGFCCDQFALHVPHVGAAGIVVWLLQYGYSATTQTNRLRLAIMSGSGIGSATPSCVYDLLPAMAGYPAGTWFDFPHLGYSDRWLYVTANVFDAAGAWQGSTVMRLALAALGACTSASLQHHRSTSVGSLRFGQRMAPTADMVFGAHASTAALRIYHWTDSAPAPTIRDVGVAAWYPGTTAVPGPDGRSFTSRSDNRLQGAWDNGVHAGFMWYSNQGGSYPRPHVRVAWFDRNTFELAGEHSIWNPTLAFAYPSVAPNIHGHVGGSIAYGGGPASPGTLAWLVDDTNCWGAVDTQVIAQATGRLTQDVWGDYYQTQVNSQRPTTWLTTGMAMALNGLQSEMRTSNVDFGRTTSLLTLRTLTVRALGAGGAAIAIDRPDNYCRAGGAADFTRAYRSSSSVNLTAAPNAGGRQFHRWRRNGSDMPVGQATVSVALTGDATVEAVYGDFSAGIVSSIGTGCRGSAPQNLLLAASAAPETARTVQLTVSRGPVLTGAALFLGASRTVWNGIPLPLTLLPGTCRVFTDVAVSMPGTTNASGSYSSNLSIPNAAVLVGSTFYAQGLAVDLAAPNPYSLVTSNALSLGIGGWTF